jgi:hypothetical protein
VDVLWTQILRRACQLQGGPNGCEILTPNAGMAAAQFPLCVSPFTFEWPNQC